MVCTHCTVSGTMDLYIMLCSVHTTLGQGTGPETIWLHTHFPGPLPCPEPDPVRAISITLKAYEI